MDKKPKIILSEQDVERIEALLDKQPAADAALYGPLRAELARGQIVETAAMPRNVVTMNSTVTFVDEESEESLTLTLVYPQRAGEADTVSIFAPIGSALLGLKVGQRIDWPMPDRHTRRLRVLKVDYPPEAAGDYHR
jgi:regulator of nucleoside diphosphate kinase